jgi:hypothetical protein
MYENMMERRIYGKKDQTLYMLTYPCQTDIWLKQQSLEVIAMVSCHPTIIQSATTGH